jgi:hypothetical protein
MKKPKAWEIKRLLAIGLSAYGPTADFTIDEWFYAKEWIRMNPQYIPKPR